MGASGAGKTTLARIMAKLILPDSGEVTVKGRLSFVFQEDRLLLEETALSNVLFVNNDRAGAINLLNRLKMTDYLKKAKDLSGGMKRRVAICRAFNIDFDVIILDEPFKGLDDKTKILAMDLVREHADKTVVYITHNSDEVKYLGGEMLEFKN